MSEEDAPMLELHTQEDRSTRSAEQARHWVGFYEELLTFEQNMLATMGQLRERSRPEIRDAVDESNIRPLEQLIGNFRERMAFWEARVGELGG